MSIGSPISGAFYISQMHTLTDSTDFSLLACTQFYSCFMNKTSVQSSILHNINKFSLKPSYNCQQLNFKLGDKIYKMYKKSASFVL